MRVRLATRGSTLALAQAQLVADALTRAHPEHDFVLEPTKALAVYRWGDKVVEHCFCQQCGIYPFHAWQGTYRVNLGCVEGIDPWEVDVTDIDGRAF